MRYHCLANMAAFPQTHSPSYGSPEDLSSTHCRNGIDSAEESK